MIGKIRLMEVLGERALWNAVLKQAYSDAFKTLSDPLSKRQKPKALDWFRINNEDFVEVCDGADKDPDYVMEKFKRRSDDFFV